MDIAIDQENHVYVAERDNHRIQIIFPWSEKTIVFGSSGLGYGCFQELTGVEVYQNKIYVTDQQDSGIRVYQFDKNFKQSAPSKPEIQPQKPKEEIQDDEEEFELR